MEQLAALFALAVQLSGLPPLPPGAEPAVWPVTETEMRALMCREVRAQCNGLQAVYDPDNNRILIREYGLQHGTEWESFLIHEYVHVLQYARSGPAIYADCEANRAAEKQAYSVQDAYLRRRGALLRVNRQLQLWHCEDLAAGPK